jgi:hypothetical protein
MVSIPVGVLVVGPMIAQKILDATIISLPNSTVSPCETLESWVQNNAEINVPFFLPSTLLPYKQVLSTTTCGTGFSMAGGYSCNDPNVSVLGSYDSPALHLSGGANTKNFSARMDLTSMSTIINGFVVPMFLPTHGNKARLILTAENVTISVLGIKMKGLTMHNELTCTGQEILEAQDIPNYVCHPKQPNSSLYNANGYYMSCVSGAFSLVTTTTTTLYTEPTTTTGKTIIF